MRFSPDWLDMLRERVMLSGLIGRDVKLIKAGHEHKALCPFHIEQTASFTVTDVKGFFHCFSCGAHGDAIEWLIETKGLTFVEAVKHLADYAGIALPLADDPAAAAREARREQLFEIMAAAASWFAAQLASAHGAAARRYIAGRGILPETVHDFALGFAPLSRDALLTALGRFGIAALCDAGLVICLEGKPAYDRFRGRLMIPIRDGRGRVIAFGGRIIGAGEPKYLNSPETLLFDKGRTLFNLDHARNASRTARRVIVVEGYLDVIALAQAGVVECVAPLGTALSEHQLATLWSMAAVPLICFDGDRAGQGASLRAAVRALPAMRGSQSLSFVAFGKDQDPDDLIKTEGRGGLEAALLNAEPLVDRLWSYEVALPLGTPEARAGLRQRLTAHVKTITDADVRTEYAAEFRRRFDAMFDRPRKAPLSGLNSTERSVSAAQRSIGTSGVDALFIRAILAGLLRYPAMIARSAQAVAQIAIADPDVAALRDLILAHETTVYDRSARHPLATSHRLGLTLMQGDGLAYSFTRETGNPDAAKTDLLLAINAVASKAIIEAALAQATAQFATDFDDASYLRQQELIAQHAQMNADLAQLLWHED